MTIIEKGQEEIARREREAQLREGRDRAASFKRTVMWFREMGHFYDLRDHLIPNPAYRSPYGKETRLIENPDNPYPEILEWEPIGHASGSTTDSTFVCEGIRYVCRWKYEGGWDRAYWDDGWWPEWYVVVEEPKWFGLRTGKREVRVHGAASVAEALRA